MKKVCRFLSVFLIMNLLLTLSVFAVSKENNLNNSNKVYSYEDYLKKYSKEDLGTDKIVLLGDKALLTNATLEKTFEGKSQVISFGEDNAKITWKFNVKKAGLYRVTPTYYSPNSDGKDISVSIYVNGFKPYSEAGSIVLPIVWKDDIELDKDFALDAQGNDVIPNRIQNSMWLSSAVTDSSGLYSEPLTFYFKKGENTISFNTFGDTAKIYSVVISSGVKAAKTYNEYKKSAKGKSDSVEESIYKEFQAERPTLKSDAYLYPTYEKSDPTTKPFDPLKLKRNIIGTNWNSPGQFLEWEIDVPCDGYYNIGVKYRQNTSEGIASLRKITIDNEVLFDELNNVEFPFTNKFKKIVFGNEKENYKFYLTAGKHTFRMEVSVGKYAGTARELDKCGERMNKMYQKIIMITSKSPDVYRDYKLEEEIPELLTEFKNISDKISECIKVLNKVSNNKIDVVTLDKTVNSINSFVDKPYTISSKLSAVSTCSSNLATYVSSLSTLPLELDYIFICSPKLETSADKVSIIKRAYYGFLNYIYSYITDYSITNVGDDVKESVDVWTSAGREPVSVIKELINTSFTKDNPNINVNLKFVHTSLIQGVLAGIEPDVILSVPSTDPVDLAMRGILEPLNKYDGFENTVSEYRKSTTNQFVFEGQTYGIPERIDFDMMFVRDDILSELGVEIPTTWDEFKDVAKFIFHKNMEVGIPNTSSFYNTLLLQNGYNPYQDNNTQYSVGSPVAQKVFKEWTQFYTDLSMPLFKDDVNRFRTGEMPICIMAYSNYSTLVVTAPEIRGDWSMYPIPGTKQENGTVCNKEVGVPTAAIMLKSSKNKETAWKFIKWWASAKTQADYGKQIEYILGPSARYTPAHPKAFENLLWTKSEIEIIEKQWDNVEVLPSIPGGYYIDRNILNAFRAVTISGKNCRESLNYWAEEINKEVLRKRKQYNLDD